MSVSLASALLLVLSIPLASGSALQQRATGLPHRCTIGIEFEDVDVPGGPPAGGNTHLMNVRGYIVDPNGKQTNEDADYDANGQPNFAHADGTYDGPTGGRWHIESPSMFGGFPQNCTISFTGRNDHADETFDSSKVQQPQVCDLYEYDGPFHANAGCRCRFECEAIPDSCLSTQYDVSTSYSTHTDGGLNGYTTRTFTMESTVSSRTVTICTALSSGTGIDTPTLTPTPTPTPSCVAKGDPKVGPLGDNGSLGLKYSSNCNPSKDTTPDGALGASNYGCSNLQDDEFWDTIIVTRTGGMQIQLFANPDCNPCGGCVAVNSFEGGDNAVPGSCLRAIGEKSGKGFAKSFRTVLNGTAPGECSVM